MPPIVGDCTDEPALPDDEDWPDEPDDPDDPPEPDVLPPEELAAVCPPVLVRLPLAAAPPPTPPLMFRLCDNTVGLSDPASAVPPGLPLRVEAPDWVPAELPLLTTRPLANPLGLAGRFKLSPLAESDGLPVKSDVPAPAVPLDAVPLAVPPGAAAVR